MIRFLLKQVALLSTFIFLIPSVAFTCTTNSDCGAGICNTKTGACINTNVCNTNKHCRYLFVCVAGEAEYGDTYLMGICSPTIVLKQMCLLHDLIAGKIARGFTALTIISFAGMFFFGKMDWKPIITLVIGLACIFGSFQLISMVLGENFTMCELVK